ncbi:MAG: hypothetical protein R3C55_11310 [Parvularculaceae bacterium]
MSDLVARIEGYASIFNTPDLNGDVVASAFHKALREKGARDPHALPARGGNADRPVDAFGKMGAGSMRKASLFFPRTPRAKSMRS